MRLLALVGGAPRGECGGSACSKGKSFAPRAGFLQKSRSATRVVFCGRRAPRRMRRFCLLKRQKLRPEGGAPTEESKCRPRCFCGSRDPAAKAMVLSAQKAKASPRGRASYRRAKAQPASLFVGGAPRGESDGSVSSKAKASPRGRASYRRAKAPPAPFFVGAATSGECGGSARPKVKSFAPRSGLLQKSQSAASVGAATPRRMRRFCLPKSQKLRHEVGPPTSHGECRRCQLNGNSSALGRAPHRMP